MEKNSFWKAVSWALPTVGTAGATTYAMDRLANPDKPFLEDWDTRRIATAGINALLGAGAGASGRLSAGLFRRGTMNPARLAKELGVSKAEAIASQGGSLTGAAAALTGGAGLIGLAPAKDLLINAQHLPGKIDKVLDATHTELKNKPTFQNKLYDLTQKHGDTLKWVGGGALGLGTIGLIAKLLKKDKPKKEVGHIRYRIPGKNGDPSTEAIVELPLDTAKLSPTMLEGIETNIRRQAVKNIKANMRKRDPYSGKLIPLHEWESVYGPVKTASVLTTVSNSSDSRVHPAASQDSEDTFTLEDFYRMKAGIALQHSAGNVKVASREFHEGAGSLLTSLIGGLAGSELGGMYFKENRGLGRIGGALAGSLLPSIIGRGLAKIQEEKRSEEAQQQHDAQSPLVEYLIPGYADYQNERRSTSRKATATELSGASFGATGMSPIQPAQGMTLASAMEADEETGYDDGFDELSKFANNAPAPAAPAKSNKASAPVVNPSATAVTADTLHSGRLSSKMNDTVNKIRNLTKK